MLLAGREGAVGVSRLCFPAFSAGLIHCTELMPLCLALDIREGAVGTATPGRGPLLESLIMAAGLIGGFDATSEPAEVEPKAGT